MQPTPISHPPPVTPGLLLVAGGWVLAPVVQFVEHFLWSDWEFAGFLAVLVALNASLQLVLDWQARRLSTRWVHHLLLRVLAYAAALITIHTLSHHTIQGAPNTVLGAIVPWLDATLLATLLLREALEIHLRLVALGFPVLPDFLLKRIEKKLHE
jgi:hypothetical protein